MKIEESDMTGIKSILLEIPGRRRRGVVQTQDDEVPEIFLYGQETITEFSAVSLG